MRLQDQVKQMVDDGGETRDRIEQLQACLEKLQGYDHARGLHIARFSTDDCNLLHHRTHFRAIGCAQAQLEEMRAAQSGGDPLGGASEQLAALRDAPARVAAIATERVRVNGCCANQSGRTESSCCPSRFSTGLAAAFSFRPAASAPGTMTMSSTLLSL